MSVVSASGKLGVSYYCPDTTVLYMMPDAAETDGHDILKKGWFSTVFCSLRSLEFNDVSTTNASYLIIMTEYS